MVVYCTIKCRFGNTVVFTYLNGGRGKEGTKANSRVWRLSYHVHFDTCTLSVVIKNKKIRKNMRWVDYRSRLARGTCKVITLNRTYLNGNPHFSQFSYPRAVNGRRVLLPWSRTWTRACGIWTGRHTTRFRPPPVSGSPGRTTIAERRIDHRRLRSPVTWTVPPSRTPWRFSVCTTPADCRRWRPRSERCRPYACAKWRPDRRRTAAAAG